MLFATVALVLAVAAPAPANAAPSPLWLGHQTPVSQPGARDGDAKYYFLLGRHLEGAGKVDEAVAAFKTAIELEPKSAEPRAELAGLYARQDKAREAVAAAEDALRVAPKNQEANRVLGTVLAALAEQHQPAGPGDDVSQYATRAMAALEIARGDGTGDLNIDLTLGRLYLDGDRYADAIPLMRRIVLDQPQYAEGWLLLAEAQEGSGGSDAAIETLTQLLDEQPQFFRARVQLAETYDRAHKWRQAADAWAAAQALNPRNTELAARHATALINGDHAADALGILRDALKQAPEDLRLTFMLAQAQRDAGDLAGAEATAKALHDAHPEDVRFVYLMSQMMEAGGRYQEMVDFLKPEIARLRGGTAKGPQVAMLLGSEGLALQQLHKLDDALAAFKEAVTLAPDDPVREVLLIQGYSAAGRHKEAIDAAEKARATFPQESSIAYQLGAALDRAGSRDGRRKDVPHPDRAGSARRRRAQLSRLHAGRARVRVGARRSGDADPARAQGRSRQSVVSRQPRLGLRAAGQARSRRPAADHRRREGAVQLGHPGAPRRSAAEAEPPQPTRLPPGRRRSPATATRSIAARFRRRSRRRRRPGSGLRPTCRGRRMAGGPGEQENSCENKTVRLLALL